jgi:hypothetical protein
MSGAHGSRFAVPRVYKYTHSKTLIYHIITHSLHSSMEIAKNIRRQAKAALTSVLLFTSPDYVSLGMTVIMPKFAAGAGKH